MTSALAAGFGGCFLGGEGRDLDVDAVVDAEVGVPGVLEVGEAAA
jgi:hypothetical protein